MSTRSLLLLFATLAAVAMGTATAQQYPNRPVRIIVPQAAGGGVDIMARAVAQKLTESWGQQIIVDNRPGANGIIGMVHVPYKGETPAITELIGGQVALLFAVSSAAAPHIRAGRARLLATGGEKRATAWPDTPTMIEAGYPKVVVTGWNGFLAPAGTPQEIIQKVHRESARHLLAPELRERLSALGAEPAGTTPEEFAAFIRSETEKWQRVSKAAGIYQSQ